jgi:5-methyltetrahydrofolate--homocysteine methyltransferase
MNPIRAAEMEAVRAANFLMNHDPNGGEWIRFSRVLDAVKAGATFAEASAAANAGGAAGGRSGRGARRRAR